ncbi:MAG: hypothetical protein KIT33_09795 [Candidatus Kapabacteria bacterium]|nr:hypothetical protein [Ignavibacteriota bacterium]MCW5885249.1 hypothetical protein [Candidatus Kapabacteria bacterium]
MRREPYNWAIVWIAAKAESVSRKEILRYRVEEFIEVVIHALDELSKNHGS